MAGKRCWYLLTAALALSVYIILGTWLSWLVMVLILVLPWLSLLVSIPAIRGFRLAPTGVDTLQMGEEAGLCLLGSCSLPMPPFRGDLQIYNDFTGERFRYRPEQGLDTTHCGGLEITVQRARVCDYLGIFSFRPKRVEQKVIRIRPRPVEVRDPMDLDKLVVRRWRPKPGGGFSENHELRPYRPGDSMAGVHWKLSAKTGDLVVREPMEPEQDRMMLTMDLMGGPEELDRKLGRLLWLGSRLVELELQFELRVLTGQGILDLPVGSRRELNRAVDQLLCQNPATTGSVREHPADVFWQYYIGGEAE